MLSTKINQPTTTHPSRTNPPVQNDTRSHCHNQNPPCNRITSRSTHHDARTTPPSKSKRNRRSPQVRTRTSRPRNDTRIMEPLCRKLLLCEEKGWQITPSTRLPAN